MSGSPTTFWTGMIELGLVNIPITIGKATADPKRDSALTDVAEYADGSVEKILRNEHVASGRTDYIKRTAVKTEDGYRVFDSDEWNAIEEATKTPTLQVVDVQPASKLPLLYTTGTYYIRHNDKAKIEPYAMATLAATLMTERLALICKWGSSARQKLCIITAERGILVMRIVPFQVDVRKASDREREHMKKKVDVKHVEQMSELLYALQNPEGFDYSAYSDEGLAMRQKAVDRILSGEQLEQREEIQQPEPVDFEAMIEKAIAKVQA
jgi:non-homologous end joining protein Ku